MPKRDSARNHAPDDFLPFVWLRAIKPKDGTAFDLPIALGYLAATGQLDSDALASVVAIGELGLDGSLRPVRGALAVARRLAATLPARILNPAAINRLFFN